MSFPKWLFIRNIEASSLWLPWWFQLEVKIWNTLEIKVGGTQGVPHMEEGSLLPRRCRAIDNCPRVTWRPWDPLQISRPQKVLSSSQRWSHSPPDAGKSLLETYRLSLAPLSVQKCSRASASHRLLPGKVNICHSRLQGPRTNYGTRFKSIVPSFIHSFLSTLPPSLFPYFPFISNI